MTRVYLYTDQPIQAKGLEAVLIATGQFQLESSYSGIPELVERLHTDAPDILLLDLTPEVTFGVLSNIKRVVQESKLVLWVNAISTELAFQAVGLGVRGILRKTLPAYLQVKCLQRVTEGELWFEKSLTDSFLAAKRLVLSQREGQLVTLLSHGLKNKEIASALQISEGTVKVYLSHLFQKVGVKDRFELALFGLKNLTAGPAQPSEKPSRLNNAPIPHLRSLVLERPVGPPAAPPPVAAFPAVRRTYRPIECLRLVTMSDLASLCPDDFLASTADLVSVLAHFAHSSRRCSSQHRRDRQLVQTALSSLLPDVPTTDQPPPPRMVLVAAPAPAPQPTLPRRAAFSGRRNPVEAKDEQYGVRRRPHCQCGQCKWCLDNARWDRVFNEKFADPTYYGSLVARHNSTLAVGR